MGGLTARDYAPGYSIGRAWWAVAVIVIFNILSLVDRTIVAVLIPEMRADLGLNDFQISLVQGMAFALFYGAAGLVIGGWVDLHSRRRFMFAGMLVWSLAAAGCGLVRNYAQLFVARLVVGIGEGAISPSAQSILSGIFPRHKLSTPMSCFSAAGVAGISVSFVLGGVLLDTLTKAPLGGLFAELVPWRQVLIVTGLPGLAVAFLAFSFREPTRAVSGADPKPEASWTAFFRFLRQNGRMLGGIIGAYGLSTMATQGTLTWAPTYARRVLGVSATDIGTLIGLAVAIGGIFGTIALGFVVDRLFSRGHRDIALRLFIMMAFIVPPLVAIAFLSGNLIALACGIALLQFTVGACSGPTLAAVQMIAPVPMRGRFAALAVLMSNLGGFAFGPMLVGAITDYGFGDPDQVGNSIALALIIVGPLGAALTWWARPPFMARLAVGEN